MHRIIPIVSEEERREEEGLARELVGVAIVIAVKGWGSLNGRGSFLPLLLDY